MLVLSSSVEYRYILMQYLHLINIYIKKHFFFYKFTQIISWLIPPPLNDALKTGFVLFGRISDASFNEHDGSSFGKKKNNRPLSFFQQFPFQTKKIPKKNTRFIPSRWKHKCIVFTTSKQSEDVILLRVCGVPTPSPTQSLPAVRCHAVFARNRK